MASRELLPLSPSDGRIVDLGASGRGVVATRNLEPGEVLFKEYPLIAMQHGSSRAAGCLNCARCFRFVGSLETQVCALLAGSDNLYDAGNDYEHYSTMGLSTNLRFMIQSDLQSITSNEIHLTSDDSSN